nr:LOW QUALITY PROTEIN: uncharacterized protein LOC119176794 [Rhipicephalus microplus]
MATIKDPTNMDWDQKIKEVESYLNTTYNASTGTSAFKLLHGYQPRMQDEHGVLRWLNTENNEWVCPEKLQEIAQGDIVSQQEKSKQHFNKRPFSADKLSVGDIVVMHCVPKHTGGAPTKAHKRCRGPLTVVEVLPADTYRVTEMTERNRVYSTITHISHLKRWGGKTMQEQFDQSSSDQEEIMPRRSTHVSKRPAYLRDYTT